VLIAAAGLDEVLKSILTAFLRDTRSASRSRFNGAVMLLLADLLWREGRASAEDL
jgi:hypothetical protein